MSERSEAQRLCWLAKVCCLDPGKLVFVDESGFNLAMTPRYARAPKGQRAYGQVPRNRGRKHQLPRSFVAERAASSYDAPRQRGRYRLRNLCRAGAVAYACTWADRRVNLPRFEGSSGILVQLVEEHAALKNGSRAFSQKTSP